MEYGYTGTNTSAIGNGHVRVSRTKRKHTLVGFDYDLSKKYITIGDYMTAIDLTNGTDIDQLNETLILYEGEPPLTPPST